MDSETERRIAATIERLESDEDITAEELEQFRQSLPTDPVEGKLVNRALPFPYSDLFEYVEGSERQSAYCRIKPDRNQPRSAAVHEHRERFVTAALETRGLNGTAVRDGRELPRSAARIAENLMFLSLVEALD